MDDDAPIRIAAAGDVHVREARRDAIAATFARTAETADVILLAGDLTTHGEPEEGAILADACRPLDVPVVTVLGNHDWHANRIGDLVAVLQEGGITVLDRSWCVLDVRGRELGIAGAKGFIGGFPGSHLPDFGEPLLRDVYSEATAEVEALERGLREIAVCPIRVVLLHYAPTAMTLQGERRDIWAFLGTDRLAAPIEAHEPHLVLHGHAHGGTFEGAICDVPVYNVSVPVIKRDFCVFELSGASAATMAIH